MMPIGVCGAALAVSMAVCIRTARAQSSDSTRKSSDRVIRVVDAKTNAPLSGVQVRDAFSGKASATTAVGTVPLTFLTFRGVAAVVELRKLGYQPAQIFVSRDDSTSLTEALEPVATLAPVVVTERYRLDRDAGQWEGFEQRCAAKSVTCVRSDELEMRATANLADVLVRSYGVTIGSCGDKARSARCGKLSMRQMVIPPSYCEPSIFIDGFVWNPTAGTAIDMTPGTPPQAPFTPTNVKAVEVYPPEIPRPARFEGNPFCGSIVIWTK